MINFSFMSHLEAGQQAESFLSFDPLFIAYNHSESDCQQGQTMSLWGFILIIIVYFLLQNVHSHSKVQLKIIR